MDTPYVGATNKATQSGTTNTVTGNLFVPKTPESFIYDADGNLLSDGRWTNSWDAENRLITMAGISTLPTAARQQLDFEYDWMGRRIRKTVSNWVSNKFSPVSTNRYVYDGWNLLLEANPSNVTQRKYIWGLDLSGSEQGAGGVGGMLAMQDVAGGNGVQFAAYDLNGNVAALVRATNGAVSAIYEYGPFGELVRASGILARTNLIRFSAKYQDDESDMLYYGFRLYNPSTGRWLSRDPIAEDGGINLYSYVDNTPVGAIDSLGLAKRTTRYVGKSFINGIGPIGSLAGRIGAPLVPGVIIRVGGVDLDSISVSGRFADQRLAILAGQVGGFLAFNQNPGSDAKDGLYRLYGKVEITASCCGRFLTSYSYETDMEGGREGPGIRGTINLDVDAGRGAWGLSPTSATVTWRTWGHPNLLPEYGFQWVAIRSALNIWHRTEIQITCNSGNPVFTVVSFRGSRYPSRKLWQDGTQVQYKAQGPFSSLWTAQSWREPTMVTE